MRDFIARRNLVLFGVLVFGVMTIAALHVAAHAVTFAPYKVNFYNAVPPEGCPNAEVPIWVNYDLVVPRFMQVDSRVPLDSVWVNEAGREIEASDGEIDLSKIVPGRGLTYISPILRQAPDTPGVYKLVSEVRVRGKVLTAEREHFFVTPSRNEFTVLEPTHPICVGR